MPGSKKKKSASFFNLDRLLLIRSPYNEEQLARIRMDILVAMKERHFDHYLQQMYKFRDEANKVLADDALISDDDYWTRPGGLCEKPYWELESPELWKEYRSKIRATSGTVAISTSLLSEKYVEQLIGTAEWMTIQQKILFKTMIMTYFRTNPRLWPVHLNMDFTFLKTRKKMGHSPVTPLERLKSLFKSLLSGSGPFILKILQQINTANTSKIDGKISVSEITKDIFSTVPALTPEETRLVTSSFAIAPSYLSPEYYNEKVLGSASIAETHQTYSDEFQQKAVIKFIKPIYAYYFLCEINFLVADAWKAIAQFSHGNNIHMKQCRKLLLFFIKEFIKEFDYYGEFVNTTIGYKYYNQPSQHVSSIVALDCKVNPFPVLVLSFVEGRSVDSWMDAEHITRAELESIYRDTDNLVRLWFKNTLWGSGFFHADLHPGNLIRTKNGVSVIDFGSCGILNKEERCAMVTAMVISGQFVNMDRAQHKSKEGREAYQTNLNVGEQFVTAIWNVCHVKNPSPVHLKEVAQKIVNLRFGNPDGGLNFSTLFLDIIQYSDDIGLCTNSAVLLFGRACAYVGSLMKRIEGRCADKKVCPQWGVDGIITSNMIRNPMQLVNFYRKGSVC